MTEGLVGFKPLVTGIIVSCFIALFVTTCQREDMLKIQPATSPLRIQLAHTPTRTWEGIEDELCSVPESLLSATSRHKVNEPCLNKSVYGEFFCVFVSFDES